MNDVTLKVTGIKIDPTQAKRGAKQSREALDSVRSSGELVKKTLRNLFIGFSAAAAVREFAAFDQQMTNVGVVAGAVNDELSQLSETARSLALGTRFDPAQVAEGMYSLASAGQSVNEIIGTLPNVLDLAEAAQADLGQTTELTVSTMAQFGIEADESQRVVDVFTASIASSSTNVQRLQVAMANSGSTAAAMNQDFESSVAVVSLLTTAFGSGEKAGTGYKSLLSSLAQNGEKLGITIADSAGMMRPLVDILDDIRDAGIPSTELMKTFGTEAGPALAVLLGEGTDAINEMREGLLSTGQASETAAKQLDTLQGDWDQLISTVSVISLELIDAFEPALRLVVQGLTAMLNAVRDLAVFMSDVTGRIFGDYSEGARLLELSTEDLKNETLDLVDAFKQLSVEEARREFKELRDEMIGLSKEITEQEKQLSDGGSWLVSDEMIETGLNRRKEAYAIMEQRLTQLREELRQMIVVEEDAAESSENLAKFNDDLSKKYESLAKSMKGKTGLLKAEIEALKGNTKAVDEFNKEQAIAIAQTDEEKEIISDLFDEYTRLRTEKQDLIDTQDRLNESQRLYNDLILGSMKVLNPYIEAEIRQGEQRAMIQELYEKGIITFDGYVTAMSQITRETNAETAALAGLGDAFENTETAAGSFFDGLKRGFKNVIEDIKRQFKDDPLEFSASIANILPGILDSIEGNDSTARAVNEIIGQIPIPGLQLVSSIIDSIDQLFGGKLLGTNYQTVSSGFNVGFGQDGVTGNQFQTQQRERSFFRGTKTRVLESELEASFRSELDSALSQAEELAQNTARALGVSYVGTINASLEQEFDANGNEIKSIINVFGRELQGGFDDLQRYLYGGSIFEQIKQIGPEVAAAVNQIQNAYIGNSERFLEAAQATLLAQTDINNGFNILVNGSLADIITMTENYNQAGETLLDTYARVTTSFKIFEEAVGIMGVSIDMTRQQAIDFAVGMADAAGGTQQLLTAWQGYYSSYYSEQELFIQQLEGVNDEVNRINSELGTDLNFDNFRSEFEAALPELSPSEVVQWLRLGNYLAEANQLAGQLAQSSLNDAINEYLGMADQLSEANYSLADQLRNSFESIKEMIAAYDGSVDAENRIAESLRSRYEMELAFIDQIRSASESITQLIAGAREEVFLTGLSDEEKYNYFKGESETAAAQALVSDSPEEIQRLTERAVDYQRRAFGLLDEGQQDELREGFLSFIDGLGEGTTARLAELETAAAEQSQMLLDSLGTMLSANAEAARENNDQFATAVDTFASATVRLDQAVTRLQQIQVTVDVRREDAFETQGGY